MKHTKAVLAELSLSDSQREYALACLTVAVDDYKHHRSRNIAQVRADLRATVAASEKLQSVLADMVPESLAAFATAYGAPKGKASQQLEEIHRAAAEALETACSQPNKVSDADRAVLASRVASMLESLGLRVAMTRPSELITGAMGGAAYADLLKAVLTDAKIDSPEDLFPIMKAGKKLSKNPKGDNHV